MDRSSPLPWFLGLAGLVPFGVLAACRLTGQTFGFSANSVSLALATYAATIASFLGGIRWGLAIAGPADGRGRIGYVLSVVPQLLAWACLALSDRSRLIALGLLVLALGPADLLLVREQQAPPWFGRLRIVLSLTAGACLLATALR